MFNSEGRDICIAIYNLLCTTWPFLCRSYHFFQTFKVLVTSYTNCLFLPKPNVPILMSSVKQKQKYMAVPIRLLHYKACFSDFWCNSSWHRLFHWKISTFSLHQLSSQTPVATGFLHTCTHLVSALLDTYVFSGKAWFPYGQPGILSVFFWHETACPVWTTGLLAFHLLQPELVSEPLFCSSLYPSDAKCITHRLHSSSRLLVLPGRSEILMPYGKSWCRSHYSNCFPLPSNA